MFTNHVVIVTGAGRGIGAAAAKLFAAQGARVIVNDLDADEANATASAIQSDGGEALAIAGSVTDPAFPDELMKQTIDLYGKINILVNNAGYTWDGMIHRMTDEQWQAILEVHATAPFRMVRALAPYMREIGKEEMARDGRPSENRVIVNVSSTSGLHGNVGQANYATGKMGIVGFTKTVAKEWGPFGVRCNAVAFGLIDTRLTRAKEDGEVIAVDGKEVELGIPERLRNFSNRAIPLQRAGTPEEAAGGILLMASPFASYITGHTLEVTGGVGI